MEMGEKRMIARADVRLALRKLQNPDRFFKEGVFKLCKEVYGDEREELVSATEMECTDYFEEGVDELYKALTGKRIGEKLTYRDASALAKWWNTHHVGGHHEIVKRDDKFYDVVRK